jgi:hypothetical protein
MIEEYLAEKWSKVRTCRMEDFSRISNLDNLIRLGNEYDQSRDTKAL